MEFWKDVTLDEIVDQPVLVVIKAPRDADMVRTITAAAFLKDDTLHIDCIPKLKQRCTVAAPDDAIISKSDAPNAPEKYALIISPNSEAGVFIQQILDQHVQHRYN